MLSALDSDIVKNMRPARASIYTDDYPPPLYMAPPGSAGRRHYSLKFNVYDWTDLVDPADGDYSSFEVIYYPEEHPFPEWAILQGEAAGVTFLFQYSYREGVWHEYDTQSSSAKPSERRRPVDPSRVRQVLRGFADTMERDLGHPCFDPQILDAVGALPLPIAEQVVWCLAPPTLEDSLRRRCVTDP